MQEEAVFGEKAQTKDSWCGYSSFCFCEFPTFSIAGQAPRVFVTSSADGQTVTLWGGGAVGYNPLYCANPL